MALSTLTSFTPWSGLLGGILIGLSATGLLLGIGRLAGVSGITYGVLDALRGRQAFSEWAWRMAFVAGLMGGAWAWFSWTGAVVNPRQHLSAGPAPFSPGAVLGLLLAGWLWARWIGHPMLPARSSNMPLLIVSGLLVGWGTSMGHGCTSGHGVCGLGRHSVRSLVATLTFMAAGGVTVFVARHVLPL